MTAPSVAPRPAERPAELRAIGRYVHPGGTVVLLPATAGDLEDAAVAARNRLRTLGLGTEDIVCLTSLLSEGVQFIPYELAIRSLGATFCPSDATPFDAYRAAAMLEQFECRLSIGLTVAVLEAMVKAGNDVSRLLAGCAHVVAPADAVAFLAGLGVDALTMCIVGPTIAMECPARSGLHVGCAPWPIESRDGELVVSGLHPSADVHHLATGLRGEVMSEPCSCGSDDPRLLLA